MSVPPAQPTPLSVLPPPPAPLSSLSTAAAFTAHAPILSPAAAVLSTAVAVFDASSSTPRVPILSPSTAAAASTAHAPILSPSTTAAASTAHAPILSSAAAIPSTAAAVFDGGRTDDEVGVIVGVGDEESEHGKDLLISDEDDDLRRCSFIRPLHRGTAAATPGEKNTLASPITRGNTSDSASATPGRMNTSAPIEYIGCCNIQGEKFISFSNTWRNEYFGFSIPVGMITLASDNVNPKGKSIHSNVSFKDKSDTQIPGAGANTSDFGSVNLKRQINLE